MKWKNLGIVFGKKNFPKWNKSHAWVPTAFKIKDSIYRIFYAGRDKWNHSNIGAFNIDMNKPQKIFNISKKPILYKGARGYFDDCAAIPCQIFKFKKKYYLYYIGWTQGVTVPYIASIGLATAKGLSGKFTKFSNAPIIGRTKSDPIFTASSFVVREKSFFRIYYTSNKKWVKKKKFIPKYNIREAISKDLINWVYNKDTIKLKKKEIAITRPWIIKIYNKNLMFYSYRSKNYKIGIAIKNKKNNWIRKDKEIKIINERNKFDNKMQEYASVIKFKKNYFMFYNGNNYGEKGIGLAILEKN